MIGSVLVSRVAAKVVPWLIALAVVLGLGLYVQWLRNSRDAANLAAGQAEAQLTQARMSLRLMETAAEASMRAVAMQAAGDRARAETLEKDLEKIRNAKRPIPAVCRDALRPLDELARQLQALSRDPGPGHPAPAKGGVHGDADSPNFRGSR